MSFTKNLSSYLTNYGTYTIGVKAHAEGFRDSETATTTYSNLPVLEYVDETELTFTNVMLGVSQIQLYIDNTLVDTIVHDATSTSDVSIDLTSYNLDTSNSHHLFIVVTAPDKTGTSSTFTSNTITTIIRSIVGVSGLYNSSVTLTRTDDAVGMTWVNSDGIITSELDNKFPFNEIKEVTLDSGDVMVEFPAMWWRIGHDSSNRLTDIAVANYKGQTGDWYHTPAFQVSKYLASVSGNQIVSVSGANYANMSNLASRFLDLKNRNMYVETIYHHTIIQFLFLIYFATKRSNDVLTRSAGPTSYTTGGLDSYNYMNCIKNNRFKLFYLEDIIGMSYTVLLGSYNDRYYDVYNNQSDILTSDERSTTNKVQLNYTTASSTGNLRAYGWDETHPFICMPLEVSGSSFTQYFAAQIYSTQGYKSTNYVVSMGTDTGVRTLPGFGLFLWNTNSYTTGGCFRIVKFLE